MPLRWVGYGHPWRSILWWRRGSVMSCLPNPLCCVLPTCDSVTSMNKNLRSSGTFGLLVVGRIWIVWCSETWQADHLLHVHLGRVLARRLKNRDAARAVYRCFTRWSRATWTFKAEAVCGGSAVFRCFTDRPGHGLPAVHGVWRKIRGIRSG